MKISTFDQLVTSFFEFEDKFNLLSKSDDSIVWEGIRLNLYTRLTQLYFGTGMAQDKSKIEQPSFIRRIAIAIIASFWELLRTPILLNKITKFHKCEILFFSAGRRKKESDGFLWDIYIDPILDILKKKYLVIEEKSEKYRLPIKTKYFLFEMDSLLIGLLSRLSPLQKWDTSKQRNYKKIEDEFNKFFSVDYSLEAFAHKYHRRYISKYSYYHKLLKLIQPKSIGLVCGYGKEALINAAKDLKIVTFEIQHGIISKYHLGYSMGNGGKRGFVDYLLTFGPAWHDDFSLPISNENVIPIGFTYLNNAVKKFQMVQKKNQILFLSQGTVGIELSEFAIGLSRLRIPNLVIIYKLHPGERLRWKTEYDELYNLAKSGEILVIEEDDPALYQLMAESKWQVGVNSTALLEGLAFNCKTYLLNLPGSEYYQKLISTKKMSVVELPSDIDFNDVDPTVSIDIDNYFLPVNENEIYSIFERMV